MQYWNVYRSRPPRRAVSGTRVTHVPRMDSEGLSPSALKHRTSTSWPAARSASTSRRILGSAGKYA